MYVGNGNDEDASAADWLMHHHYHHHSTLLTLFMLSASQWGEVSCFKVGQLIAAVLCLATVLLRYLPLVRDCCDEDPHDEEESDVVAGAPVS